MLNVNQLCYERNEQTLLNELCFNLHAGVALQVTGPNGCGKTSLLRILCGLLTPLAGTITWNSTSIAHCRDEYLAELIYLGHHPALKTGLTLHENLTLMSSMAKTRLNLSITDALQYVGLAEYENSFAQILSAGQQRRLTLAKLLLIKAKLWILDEPFTALDETGVALVEALLTQHIAQGGMAILTSHQAIELNTIKQKKLCLHPQTNSGARFI